MKLTTKVDKKSHIENWIKLWNGGFQLTNKEQEFLYEVLYIALDLTSNGIKEPFMSQLLFSTETMKDISKKLDITAKSLQNYKYQLVEKKVLSKKEDRYYLNPIMIPVKEVTFKFRYDEG